MAPKEKKKPARAFTIKEGEFVIHDSRRVWVRQVLVCGHEPTKKTPGEKSDICVCQILENGQILTRSPKHVGTNWDYEPKPKGGRR